MLTKRIKWINLYLTDLEYGPLDLDGSMKKSEKALDLADSDPHNFVICT